MSKLTERGRRRVYRVLVYVAQADGEIHPKEREFLDAVRDELGIPEEEIAGLEDEASRGEGLEIGSAPHEGNVALKKLSQLVFADGVFHPEEGRRMKRISKVLGANTQRLAKIVKRSMIERNQAAQRAEEEDRP